MNPSEPKPAAGLFPHPILSLVLLGAWLLLNNSVHPRMILMGGVLALAIPLFTRAFWPDRPTICRPLSLVRFLPVFVWDVVIANLEVAWLIVNFRRTLRPGWIVIPLDIRDPYAITTLANVISLTPGTVSSELGPGRATLLVHSLDVDDADAMVARIKNRYEKPIKEIFEC
ncbi:MAG: Na+/H+ antiporter subunit E [Gemmatimonadota bacterium]